MSRGEGHSDIFNNVDARYLVGSRLRRITPELGRGKQVIIFDGDDTLWSTEHLYDEARGRACQIVQKSGLNGSHWDELERAIDVENVEIYGHKPERFPTSCVEAYEAVCGEEGKEIDPRERADIYRAARSVFENKAPLVRGAKETLSVLKRQGFRLALLTKGDLRVQEQRIAQSGLSALFEQIDIVESKDANNFKQLLERMGASEETAISVGNSMRSDINPSLEVGMTAVWIDAHVWEYERENREITRGDLVIGEYLSELSQIRKR